MTSVFLSGKGLAQLRTPVMLLLAVVLARATVAWATELAAGRCSARAKSQLRAALLDRVSALGADASARRRRGSRATGVNLPACPAGYGPPAAARRPQPMRKSTNKMIATTAIGIPAIQNPNSDNTIATTINARMAPITG